MPAKRQTGYRIPFRADSDTASLIWPVFEAMVTYMCIGRGDLTRLRLALALNTGTSYAVLSNNNEEKVPKSFSECNLVNTYI